MMTAAGISTFRRSPCGFRYAQQLTVSSRQWALAPWPILAAFLLALSFSCNKEQENIPPTNNQQAIVFSKTAGFRHRSIEPGIAALQRIIEEQGMEMLATEDAEALREALQQQPAAVIFLNTTGDILNPGQEAEMERYIRNGGGFMGIHSATDTEYGWPWYGRLVGAYFKNHPPVQEARLEIVKKDHPATTMLPSPWTRRDEWYNFRDIQPGVEVLITVDENSYDGGTHGDFHPIAWARKFEGGRTFYTAGGHTPDSFEEELFLQHLAGGLRYVSGR